MTNPAIQKVSAVAITRFERVTREEPLVVEQPLEIRLLYDVNGTATQKTISITMRTPGNDKELAAGFLFTEGIIRDASQIKMITPGADGPDTTLVILEKNIEPALFNADRNFYTSSSCGVCGKASIEAIKTVSVFAKEDDDITIEKDIVFSLPETVEGRQAIFDSTGGLHACALFDLSGDCIDVMEDVGRHNALDKLIGNFLMEKRLPLSRHILFLSGRASFELVQKAYMAGIRMIAAVGAPSSLAVELAESNGITLIGFLRGSRFNVYSGYRRIR